MVSLNSLSARQTCPANPALHLARSPSHQICNDRNHRFVLWSPHLTRQARQREARGQTWSDATTREHATEYESAQRAWSGYEGRQGICRLVGGLCAGAQGVNMRRSTEMHHREVQPYSDLVPGSRLRALRSYRAVLWSSDPVQGGPQLRLPLLKYSVDCRTSQPHPCRASQWR